MTSRQVRVSGKSEKKVTPSHTSSQNPPNNNGDSEEVIHINEFKLEDIPLSCTFIMVGPPGSGKSSFMKDILYYRKHVYPVARCFAGTQNMYEDLKEICGPLYVTYGYNEQYLTSTCRRLVKCNEDKKKGLCQNPYMITIVDDCTDDPQTLKSNLFRAIYKKGSQHWPQCFLLGLHVPSDSAMDIRTSTSYVAIGRQPEPALRKRLYDCFGGTCGTFARFNALMDELTSDHTFLIIKKRSDSNNIEDCVFYYTTHKELPKYKFGCKEYRQHNDERYDSNYDESGHETII